MIDIRTATPANNPLSLPFDWQLGLAADQSSFPYLDYSNPCMVATPMAVVLKEYALQLDDTLHTAVVISLFSDRRAGRDVKLPHNQTDRRGWCGDEFVSPDDPWGSDLWQCYITKAIVDVEERARFAAWESLQWLIRANQAQKIVVDTSWTGESSDRLALRPQIWRSTTNGRPDYDVLWGTTLRKSQ
jgi:phage gp46-like protein